MGKWRSLKCYFLGIDNTTFIAGSNPFFLCNVVAQFACNLNHMVGEINPPFLLPRVLATSPTLLWLPCHQYVQWVCKSTSLSMMVALKGDSGA